MILKTSIYLKYNIYLHKYYVFQFICFFRSLLANFFLKYKHLRCMHKGEIKRKAYTMKTSITQPPRNMTVSFPDFLHNFASFIPNLVSNLLRDLFSKLHR